MKKTTTEYTIEEKKDLLEPKKSTITFLMNLARVYNCTQKGINQNGYYLN